MDNVESKYVKNLDLYDLFFAGFGFIIGAGIFTLIPIIIWYGRGASWLSFVIGGSVCMLTGLSYAKLNLEYPTNDAEYAWIYNILRKDKNTEPNIGVKGLANITIWAVMIIGLFNAATVVVGQAKYINSYINMPKQLLILLLIIAPTIVNSFGNEYSTFINKLIMSTVTVGFFILYGIAGVKGPFFKEISGIPDINPLYGLLKSSFTTIFAFNGFQSIVQMSEEAKNKADIPKAIIAAIGTSTIIYAAIAISVIALIGLNRASTSIYPISEGYSILFGTNGVHFVNFIAIIVLSNTLMLIILSRSRLLQKLSVRGLAPKIFKRLTSAQEIIGIERFTNKEKKITLPIYSIITISLITYILTFIRGGDIGSLATITNAFIFFVFIIVNLLVIIQYYKKKENKLNTSNIKLLHGFPWYAFLGTIVSVLYFIQSFVV